jgi:hypothetical protein
MKKKDILQSISDKEASSVLQKLVATSPAIRKKAEEIALALLVDVDAEEVAEDVLMELESLRVEDIWDNSGSMRDGYVDPGDYAWEMFAEALQPFLQEMLRYQNLAMNDQAKLCCLGILEGIHRFETESESEFKDWAVDASGEYFVRIYDEWKKAVKNKKEVAEVRKFIKDLAPGREKYCK